MGNIKQNKEHSSTYTCTLFLGVLDCIPLLSNFSSRDGCWRWWDERSSWWIGLTWTSGHLTWTSGRGVMRVAMTPPLTLSDDCFPALLQLYSSVPVEVAVFGCHLNVQCFLQEEFFLLAQSSTEVSLHWMGWSWFHAYSAKTKRRWQKVCFACFPAYYIAQNFRWYRCSCCSSQQLKTIGRWLNVCKTHS